MRDNVIYEESFKFAIETVELCKDLQCPRELSRQLLKAGTSIGANVREAVEAQSRKDFVSKMNIALKEANETKYWLDLLVATDYLDNESGKKYTDRSLGLIKILTAIIKSTKANSI